jgi:hypothetical protein
VSIAVGLRGFAFKIPHVGEHFTLELSDQVTPSSMSEEHITDAEY